MKYLIILLIAPLGTSFGHQVLASPQRDSLLTALNTALEQRTVYTQQKLEKIGALSKSLQNKSLDLDEVYALQEALFMEYRSFKYDSAFVYATKLQATGRKMNAPDAIANARLKMGFILISSGLFKEAFDSLQAITVADAPLQLRREYYALMSRAYYDLQAYNAEDFYADIYLEQGNRYADSAIAIMDPNTHQTLYLQGIRHMKVGDSQEAKSNFLKAMEAKGLTDRDYAIITSTLGAVYAQEGNIDNAIEMMIKAAIADVRSGTTEAIALINLANLLYNKGYEDRAYTYIKQGMADAQFYGARQRKIQASSIMPIIEGERLSRVEQQRQNLLVYAIVLSAFSIIIIGFVFIIAKQLKQLRKARMVALEANNALERTNGQLKAANDMLQKTNIERKETNDELQLTNVKLIEANTIKVEYIGYSFNIYYEYIGKLDLISKEIRRIEKISEIPGVLKRINLDKEREAFFMNFDKTFLNLFPNFIGAFNACFNKEDKFLQDDADALNVELRIFALIRIGISDHEQIARLLDYSVRTIYNYKTKVKNRSFIENEAFESKIMEIKAF